MSSETPILDHPPGDSSKVWDLFLNASGPNEFFDSWLLLQLNFLNEALQATIISIDENNNSFSPISKWPVEGSHSDRLTEVSEHAVSEGCGIIMELPSLDGKVTKPTRYGIAYPVEVDNQVRFVVSIEVAPQSKEKLKPIMEQLQWGSSWLELSLRRRNAVDDEAALSSMKAAIDLLAGVLSKEHFKGACMGFVTELSNSLDCDRVSIGFLRKGFARVETISHSAAFGKKMNLVKAIGKAMDEAILQRREIVCPPLINSEMLITREHEALIQKHGAESVLTMPLYGNDLYHGAITLERPVDNPFSEKDLEFCRSVAALATPALENKRLNDRNILHKIGSSIYGQLARLFGTDYMVRKLFAIFLTAIIAFFIFAKGDYRISADAALEGKARRMVVAPFNGYIEEASARAGDVVSMGEILCRLDDRDLRLERLKWLSQNKQYERQYQAAMAEHKRAEAKIADAQADQAMAQLELVESNLDRVNIKAPFDGLVISGDLSQRLGGAVEQGEVLFELAPLDTYRIILKVDEKDIADLNKGQRGILVLSSLPEEQYEFNVRKITPIAAAEEGINYFRVEAELENVSKKLRPGMEGIGKVFVDRRNLFYIWTKPMIDWLRLFYWKWMP
jgi:RND family efflux transporter MFP subunit